MKHSLMKRIHLLMSMLAAMVTLLMPAAAVAAPITADAALRQAREFISHSGMRKSKGEPRLTLSFTIDRPVRLSSSPCSMVYAFNVADGGFVIASGDDVAIPILGYGEGAEAITWETMPENMRAWLEMYADEIAWAQRVGYQPSSVRAASKAQIDNMVPTVWNQKAPYNQNCTFSGTTCLTGCVATAMAQIMYYWGCVGRNGEKFQHGCTALDSYSTATKSYSVGALDAIASFDWSSMTATKPTADAAKTAVATLMRYCGQSVKMDYTKDASGAFSDDIPTALKNCFGYDSGARYVKRAHITSTQWADMIYNELAEGRPVIMGGSGSLGGHEFICTGYQASTDKYYINWGWNDKNGWFALTSLVPDPKNTSTYGTFNNDCDAIIGIQPPTGNTDMEDYDMLSVTGIQLMGPRTLQRESRAYDGEETVGVICAVSPNFVRGYEEDEYGWKYMTYDYACGVFDETGRLMKVVGEENGTFGESEYCISFSLTIGEEWPYGTYTIVPVCRISSDDDWHPMYHSDTFYVKAEVSEAGITLTPSTDIQVTNFTSTKKSSEKKYTNTLTFKNTGCEELCGTYYVYVGGSLDKKVELKTAPGSTGTISLTKTSKKLTNTTLITLSRDDWREMTYWTNQPETSNALVHSEMWFDNYTDNNYLIGDTIKARLRLVNNNSKAYQHDVTATLMVSYDETTSMTKNVNIPAYSEEVLEFDFPGVESGNNVYVKYNFPHFYYDEVETEKESGSRIYMKGVVVGRPDATVLYRDNQVSSMTIPSDALYVDARYSARASSLPAGGNSNTLFVFAEGTTVPSALEDRNVVTGNHAEIITLDDSYPFLSPVSFTADDISYTRTFSTGHHGGDSGGWSTIALPFSVEKEGVTVDGEATPWFVSPDDEGRKFWLYGFGSDDGRVVTFSYVNTMEAYTPYIIAVPDNTWGRKYDLRDKTFTFTGHDASIRPGASKAVADKGGKYDLIGRTHTAHRSMVYALNDEGNDFVFTEDNVEIAPYRAYFAGYYNNGGDASHAAVQFCFDSRSATPVTAPLIDQQQDSNAVYTLQGVRLPEHGSLPKGIYIWNGKKIVVE